MVSIYQPSMLMKAPRLVAENVEALLKQRGFKQTDLAKWCHRSDPWVSQFLKGLRKWSIDDLDRVADLLGVPTYQLLLPGVSSSTEHRRVNRRDGKERRRTTAARVMLPTQIEIDRVRSQAPGKGRRAQEADADEDPIQRIVEKAVRDVRAAVDSALAHAGGQTPVARIPKSPTRPHARTARRSDDSLRQAKGRK